MNAQRPVRVPIMMGLFCVFAPQQSRRKAPALLSCSCFLSFFPSFAAARIDGQGQSIRRTKPVSQLPRPFAHSDGDFNGCLCQMAVISQTIYVLYFTRPGKSSFAVSRIPSACAAQHDTTCAAKAAPASALRACCTRASELRAMAN